jgi:hypothetical protein
MSLHEITSLDVMAIAHPREIHPHMIVPSYIEDIHGPGCDKIYTDEPITDIQGRVFHFDVPLTPVKLIPSANEFLTKLKARGSTHINLLCAEYVAFRYERFAGINRDVGILLQLPRPRAQNALNMAKDKDGDVKASKMKNKHLKALVLRLRGKEDEYLEAVKASWLHHDHGNFEHKLQYYKDLGALMQFASEQSREILRILLEMVLEGKTVKEKNWDNDGFEFFWRIVYDVDAPVRASAPHVQDMPAPPEPDADTKRKAPSEDGEEESLPQKKFKRGGYVPREGEWKCGKCGWWNNFDFCNRKNRHEQSICIGRRGGTQG